MAEAGKNPSGGAGASASVPSNSQSGESEAKMLAAWVLDWRRCALPDAKRAMPTFTRAPLWRPRGRVLQPKALGTRWATCL